MKKVMNIIIKCLTVSILATQLIACTNVQLPGKVFNTKIQEAKTNQTLKTQLPKQSLVIEEGGTIETRILPPKDFQRVAVPKGSYAQYLRMLPLKPHASPVLYYNGAEKNKTNVYMAVVDMEIGERDLQQCADSIMRLRGEYLYGIDAYDKIHFNFTNGFRADYSKWMKGYRIDVEGNQCFWVKRMKPSNTYQDFRRYMDVIFAYAGTISLEKELIPVDLNEMEIGDVLIQGGSPGHAVVVVDMAVNKSTGEKLFLLAQGYMPAQETQILVNPIDEDLSPWYSLNFTGKTILTPEWTFNKVDLKRFP